MRKFISGLMVLVLLFGVFPGFVLAESAATPTPISIVVQVEKALYGEESSGALGDRINRVELALYGEVQAGALFTRIDRVRSFIEFGGISSLGLIAQANLLEWLLFARITDAPLATRLQVFEKEWYGEPKQGPVLERLENLMMELWGGLTVGHENVALEKGTLVKVRLLDSVDTGTSRVGETVRYRVIEDVKVDDLLVIPAGTVGSGHIVEVVSPRQFGQDGKLEIDFGQVGAFDGSVVRLSLDELAMERNRSLEAAAGASMAGMLLLGPVGLLGGLLVRGRDVEIPEGTNFFLQLQRDEQLLGFSLTP